MKKMKMVRGYPEYMRESIELVEKTRDERLKHTFKDTYRFLTLEEREDVLKKWHPDYKEEMKRPLKIGPNKGDKVPHEVADLLEAHPLVNPDDIDLSHVDYDADILIIGSGGAGLAAALWASYSGIDPGDILIATKLRLGDANSKMSQAGIQAADRPQDSPILHYLDIMGAGHFVNDRELVKTLVMEAPFIIKWLEELGVMFDKEPDGTMVEDLIGGLCRFRVHCCRDYTGLEIMRNLMDDVLNLGIPVVEFSPAIELIMDEYGQVAGAVLWNMETEEYYVARAKSTVLATGGFGRLHIQGYATTNHYGSTADGLVLAYRVGAKMRDMDSVQYHPTGAAYPEAIVGLLCTAKLRGRGAQPVNKYGEVFVNPLEPRDVEAAMIIRECYGKNNGVETPTGMRGVWLDTPMIDIINGEGTIEKAFPAMFRQFKRQGIDMRVDPILVFPTLHYQNGGIVINVRTETGVPGLFAAGEVTGGVHGKNRLVGNSWMELMVFGRRAGIYAAERAKKAKLGKLTLDHVRKYEKMLEEAGVRTDRRSPMVLPNYKGERAISHALHIL
ncbi:FAD-binding protein [Candidatus Bathyarchaeota archaeon]|nr:FAD-binding protein [Candidatus Bathyarchaeota archaeon]